MKISIDDLKSDNPNTRELALNTLVKLNGLPVQFCVEADDVEGYVICYKTNKQGGFELDRKNRAIVTETLRGKVTFTDMRNYNHD